MAIVFRGLCPLIQVFDISESLRFYRDILGFAEVERSEHEGEVAWVWLRKDEANIMLNTAYDVGERPSAPNSARVASHADTCFYFDCEDLEGAYDYLTSVGFKAERPTVTYYNMKQLYLSDPDGYGLCFQWPVKPSRESSSTI